MGISRLTKNNITPVGCIAIVLVIVAFFVAAAAFYGWLLMLLVGMLYATFAWPTVTISFVTAVQFALVLGGLGLVSASAVANTKQS